MAQREFLITSNRNHLEKKQSFREVSDDVVKEIKEIRAYSNKTAINDSSQPNGQVNETTHQFEKRIVPKKRRNLTEIDNT